jgi:hypothetical protein
MLVVTDPSASKVAMKSEVYVNTLALFVMYAQSTIHTHCRLPSRLSPYQEGLVLRPIQALPRARALPRRGRLVA